MTTSKRGFTLIEMIVSLGIFAFVVTVVAGAYLNLVNIDRETRGTNNLVNNLSFAVDSMSRDIRTGTNYQCGGYGGANCAVSPSSTFTFVDSSGNQVTYLLNNGEIGECTGTVGSGCTASSATYFTDPGITVSSLAFYVSGVGTTDTQQPIVTFSINGTISASPTDTVSFTTETTATERGIDI
jgi:prepilin-type N-terminal cleavage/methylation domain-containing protein